MAAFVLTIVGPDRPGLVSELAEQVAARGGNWLESRMARLAGQFAGIASVVIADEEPTALREALGKLAAEGYRVVLQEADAPGKPASTASLRLELVGQDRPGIVRAITRTLAARGVNIEELITHVGSGSFSGETMFRAEAQLRAPASLAASDIRKDLEALGDELMVDITVSAGPE